MKARTQNQNLTEKKADRKKLLPKAKELKMTGPLKKILAGAANKSGTSVSFICSVCATC